MFTRGVEKPRELFVWLYVEKGVDGSAAEPFLETTRGRRYVMDPTWIWGRFTSALASGDFEQLVGAAEAHAGGA
ncbi:MAG: hypothetical protein A3K12_06085 [Candidatus Rokubacteria bacterium RIFCSPLOWO2_12_FULL_71_19]|nr:MAG: hypothetical protein A3K12_06085 [Candidatus Rokubacteria bacterium RIFCSPLOWO2_12_FULL_71_19]